MAGRVIQRPPATTTLTVANVTDPPTQRALDQLAEAIQRLQSSRAREQRTVDLVVGTNVVRHGLGRPVLGYTLTPTVADATFAHAIDASNPRPDGEVWITVIGVAQPGARLEVW